jgi:hypothetical protein
MLRRCFARADTAAREKYYVEDSEARRRRPLPPRFAAACLNARRRRAPQNVTRTENVATLRARDFCCPR